MPNCKAGQYKSNIILSRSPLICVGGNGQCECQYLDQCRKSLLSDYEDWSRKNGLNLTTKNFGLYFTAKMKEMNNQNKGE